MKTTLLKLVFVVAVLSLGAITATGLIPDDADGDGVPNADDQCPAENASGFDRDADGCIDAFVGARHIEYWSVEDAVIPYVINSVGAPDITNGSDLTAVQNAVSTWMAVPNTDLNVVFAGTTSQTNSNGLDRVNLVTFVDNAYPFSNLVLAVGLSTSFEADTLIEGRVFKKGEIFDADMVFNPTKTYKVGGSGPGVDIQSVATHEAGHLFGISHSAIQSSTMFYVLPGGLAARSLEMDDQSVFFKAYGDPTALSASNRIDGIVTDGQTDDPVPGAAVFLRQGSDTVACEYTLPDGTFSFPGLANTQYTVAIHPIDGSAAVGFIQPANINALVSATAVENFVPEFYDADESATDNPSAVTAITLSAGNPTESIEIVTNIDAVAPVVMETNPGNNATSVAIDAAYIIRFSEEIKLSTLSANFQFRELSTDKLRGGNIGVIEEGRVIVFTPSPPLAFSENYTMTLATGLTDEFGNHLAAPFTLSLSTEPEPPVGLTSLSPNKGVLGTTVVITGRGFDTEPPASVTFGAMAAAVTSATATRLVVIVPQGASTSQVTVTNADLQVSNPLTFTVLTTAEVARGFDSGQTELQNQPSAIAVVPDGGYAYIATDGGVEAIVVSPSLPDYLTSTPISYPGGVEALAPTPSGRRVYGVSKNNRELIEINSDPTTGLLFNTVLSSLDVGAAPKGVVVEPSGYRAYVATDEAEIQSWDIKLGSATYQQQVNALSIPGGAGAQGAMAVTPSGDRLLALTDTGSLLFYSVDAETLLTSVNVGADPRDVVIEPTEERAYVSHGDGRVSVVNIGGTPFKVQDIQTGGSLRGLAVTPASRFIYASDRELDNLKIIDLDVTSPTFRSVVEDIDAPTNPVDVVLTPDGVYALSLLQGDGPNAATNPSRMLVTTIGAGPALHSIYPQAGRVGARVVLSGDSFGDGSDFDVATVDFNGVVATPIVYEGTHVTVVVPPGATSGPVRIRVTINSEGPGIQESNALAFQVLLPSPLQTNVREAATIENASVADFEDAIAISPDGNTIFVGTGDGYVIAYDTRPGSPTFHQELDRFQYFTTAIEDIAITADGKTGYVTADQDAHVVSFRAVPSDPNFGALRESRDIGFGPVDYLKSGPDNRVLLVNAGVNGVRIMGTSNHFDGTPMVDLGQIGTGGNVLDMAFHPSGLAAYIAIRNPDAVLTVDMDETGIEFGLVEGVYELPGAPAPTPMSLAVYPDGSKLLVQCLQLQGPAARTIFTFNVGTPPYSLSSGPTYTPSGTASHQYQERIRISPKADVGLRSVADNGFQYFDINSPGTAINTVGLLETLVGNEFEFTPDGNRVYMASAFHDSVRVFDFTPADNLTIASGNNQNGVAGQPLAALLRVAVGGHINIGEFFQPVVSPGIPVTFRVQSGGGMLRVGDTEADVVVVSSDNQGLAQVVWRLGPGAGTQTVTAQSSNLYGSPLLFSATASPDPNSLPLALSELIPLNNSANVSVTTAVLATFSRAIAPGSISPGSLYLERVAGSIPVPTAYGFTDGNRKVSLTPISSLPYSEQIRVVYTAAIEDAVGGTLTTPGNSAFMTQAPQPPRVSAISPPSALRGVTVTISGSGFDPVFANNTVNFTGGTAIPIDGSTDFLRVVVPTNASAGLVSVSADLQTSNAVPFNVLVPNTSPIDDVIATIGTVSGTKSCAISPDGALCYNVSAEGDVVVPVDIEGQTTFPSIQVGDQPIAIVIDPSGTFAYVANFNSGSVSVIDVDADSPTFNTVVSTIIVGTNPTDVAIFPDGDRVLVANGGSGDVSVIDGDPSSATFNQVTATIGTASGTKSVAISGDGASIYLGTDYGIVVLEANSYSVTATIGTASGTKSLAISPDGTLLFVLGTNGTLSIVDITPGSGSENQVVATIGTGSGTKSMAISADGTLLYLIQEDSDQVIVVALEVIPGVGVSNPNGVAPSFKVSFSFADTLTTGDDPADIVVDPSGSGRVIVANAGDKSLTVYGPSFGPIEGVFKVVPGVIIPKLPGFYVLGVLQLPSPLSVHDVDISTVRVFDTVHVSPGKFYFTDVNHDGVDELSVLFCRDEFLAAMPENGELVHVVAKGTVAGDDFEGDDTIHVLRPTISKPEENEHLHGGEPYTFRWTTPLDILPCDQVKIEWRTNGDDADDIDCDFHHVNGGEESASSFEGADEIDQRQRLDESADVSDAGWTLIANHVANDGDYTWAVPVGYYPNARLRITLLWFGFKVGSSEVPFKIEMPVPVRLKSFDVTMEDGAAVLRWETSLEVGMEGYQIVRSEQETGQYASITKDMVRSSGEATGASYEYRDESVTANRTYWYKLREVADDGLGAEYGPYSVTYRLSNQLDQNVPNPFNPTTTIRYAIASDANVNLTIYDVAGRKVKTLVNERQRADVHRVVWDGVNDTGSRVASGVYFYKLVAGKYSQTKKMLLLK